MEKVERTQHKAALAITDTWQGSNRSKPYLTVVGTGAFFRSTKIKNNMTPSYLRGNVPPNRRFCYSCNTSNAFHEIRCKTSRTVSFPINLWNNIIS